MDNTRKRAKSNDYPNYRKDALQKVTEERNKYRQSFLFALKLLLPPPHNMNCTSVTHSPIFSSILPLIESVKVRMVIGSHLKIKACGSYLIHRECVMDINVPPTCCLVFYHDRTLHGGGPSSGSKKTRMFSLFGPEDHYSGISNENYTKEMKDCTDKCTLCHQLKNIRIEGGGFFDQRENDHHMVKVGSLINDYNLEDHGFCILKTAKKQNLKKGIVNQVLEIDRDGNKMKFGSIGQEELDLGGTRDTLDNGIHLNPDMFLKKR